MVDERNFIRSEIFDIEGNGLCGSHLLFTRFGIGITDDLWLQYRIRLFRAVTLPSVDSQKSNKVVWVIFIDSSWPDARKDDLWRLTVGYPYIKIVELEFYFEYYLYSCEMIKRSIRKFSSCLVSKIDDDDAIAHGVFDRIYEERSDWFVYTFVFGSEFLCQERVVRDVKIPFLTMNTHFHMREQADLGFMKIGHHNVEDCAVREGRRIVYDDKMSCAWLYSRHKQSDSRFSAVRKSILEDEAKRVLGAKDYVRYGINFDFLQDFRSFAKDAPATPNQKTWLRHTELNDSAEHLYIELKKVRDLIRAEGASIFL